MVSAIDVYSAAARRIGNLPDGWQVNIFQKVTGGVLCTGAVSPPYGRGPRKGERNWPKRDRATEATVVVTHEAYDVMRSLMEGRSAFDPDGSEGLAARYTEPGGAS